MDDEQEMEEFELNDEDLQRAYNPSYKRHKMTKEEAMLGIWASRDEYLDSEDEDQFSYQKQKKYPKSNIDFVSSKTAKKAQEISEIDADNHRNNQDLFEEDLGNDSDSDNDNMEELKTKNFYQVNQSNITTSSRPITQKQTIKITK